MLKDVRVERPAEREIFGRLRMDSSTVGSCQVGNNVASAPYTDAVAPACSDRMTGWRHSVSGTQVPHQHARGRCSGADIRRMPSEREVQIPRSPPPSVPP